MKKIKEGEEFEMAGTIFSYTRNPDNSIQLHVVKKSKPKKEFTPPTLEEVKAYFKSEGYSESLAETFFKGYDVNDWKDSNEKPIKNWKQKAIQVWFKHNEKEITQQPKMVR